MTVDHTMTSESDDGPDAAADADQSFADLSDYIAASADMRIECVCGRVINVPSDQILIRFGAASSTMAARIRLRCLSCRRRGHATVAPIRSVRR